MPQVIDVRAFVEFEASGWSRVGDAYHRFFGAITGRVVEPLLDAAAVASATRLLDVATGPGYAAGRAVARGAAVVGMDIAAEMLTLARRLVPGVAFHTADAHELPFEDASFDAVVGNFLVPHLADHDEALGEFTRVLAPRGRVALSTWDHPERVPLLGAVVDAARRAGAEPPPGLPAGPDFFGFAADDTFAALLRRAGLADVAVHRMTFTHLVPSAAALWDGLVGGTVRTAALVCGQPPTMQQRIRAAFDEVVEPYRADGGLDLPVSIKIASGRKPR